MSNLTYRGIPITSGRLLPVKIQTRFPKSKRKRLRKKFAKKYSKLIEREYVLIGDLSRYLSVS